MGDILAGNERVQGVSLPKGARATVGRTAVANGAGLTEHERKTALRVSRMPEREFERRVKDPDLGQQRGKPSPFIICPHCGKKIIR